MGKKIDFDFYFNGVKVEEVKLLGMLDDLDDMEFDTIVESEVKFRNDVVKQVLTNLLKREPLPEDMQRVIDKPLTDFDLVFIKKKSELWLDGIFLGTVEDINEGYFYGTLFTPFNTPL